MVAGRFDKLSTGADSAWEQKKLEASLSPAPRRDVTISYDHIGHVNGIADLVRFPAGQLHRRLRVAHTAVNRWAVFIEVFQ